eukprot:TRINITY_DN42650_c0_g1_i2.p1 TRINITY_DN42650_c0_g1~~TRINITY_DN42650_c0_g1_i2.p1  ORF type:complete len:1220 (-),score=381.37 TRINITY_DN42650_c0_g1_i2:278-3937(-)
MALSASASAPAFGPANPGGGNDALDGGDAQQSSLAVATHVSNSFRGRSGSPKNSRILAGHMRRFARGMRESSIASDGNGTMPLTPDGGKAAVLNCSVSSIEPPSDRAQSLLAVARMAVQQQVTPVAERLGAAINQLQARADIEERRVERFERKVYAELEEIRTSQSRDHGGSTHSRLAELQGCVSGMMDEVKALTLRVEGLDERLWSRTGGTEAEKKRTRELEQQVQTLEHQSRLALASTEETLRRQVAKARRTEQGVEELTRRCTSLEDDLRSLRPSGANMGSQVTGESLSALEARVDTKLATLEQKQDKLADVVAWSEPRRSRVSEDDANALSQIRAAEQGLADLERRLSGQLRDLASNMANMRVKVDGQVQRTTSLAERLETAHEPALAVVREELTQARAQDWHRLEVELAQLKGQLQEAAEEAALEESRSSKSACDSLRQSQSDLAAQLRRLGDRLNAEVGDLRLAVEARGGGLHRTAAVSEVTLRPSNASEVLGSRVEGRVGDSTQELDFQLERLEELEARLRRLEAGGALPLKGSPVARGAEALTAPDAESMKAQVEHLQGVVAQLSSNEVSIWHSIADVEARVVAVVQDFERTATSPLALGSGTAVLVGRGPAMVPHPVDLAARQRLDLAGVAATAPPEAGSESQRSGSAQEGSPDARRGTHETSSMDASWGWQRSQLLRQELEAVAERLKVTDALASRLAALERAVTKAASSSASAAADSPGGTAAADDGSDARSRAIAAAPVRLQGLSSEVSELQARLLSSQLGLQTGSTGGADAGAATGAASDSDEDAPREDEIVALAERVAEAEREFAELLQGLPEHEELENTATLSAAELTAALLPARQDVDEDFVSARASSAGAGRAGQRSLSDHIDNGCGDEAAASADKQLVPLSSAGIDEDARMVMPAGVAHLGIFANQLGVLESVLRGFAGQLDAAKGGGEGVLDGHELEDPAMVVALQNGNRRWSQREAEDLRVQLEHLKAHVSMSVDSLVEQHRELRATKADMRAVSDQVAELGEILSFTRQQVDLNCGECKSVAQRLRDVQERDVASALRKAGESSQGIAELNERVNYHMGLSDRRLEIVEAATMALKQDLSSYLGLDESKVTSAGSPIAAAPQRHDAKAAAAASAACQQQRLIGPLSQERLQQIRATFEHADVTRAGSLDQRQLQAALKDLGLELADTDEAEGTRWSLEAFVEMVAPALSAEPDREMLE